MFQRRKFAKKIINAGTVEKQLKQTLKLPAFRPHSNFYFVFQNSLNFALNPKLIGLSISCRTSQDNTENPEIMFCL